MLESLVIPQVNTKRCAKHGTGNDVPMTVGILKRRINTLRAVAIATVDNNMHIRSCICGPSKLQRDSKIIP